MESLVSNLIIYRNSREEELLMQLADIYRQYHEGNYYKDSLRGEVLDFVNDLLNLATRYGFNGNLWHNYLAFILAMTETPFTLVCEKTGANEGTVNVFAKNDFHIFKQLFDYDFSDLEKDLDLNCFTLLEHYEAVVKEERIFNKSVSEKVQELSSAIEQAESDDELYQVITDFYKRYGVGKYGLNKAFRLSDNLDEEFLIPITNTSNVMLDDLIGYESQKKQLTDNTEAFVERRKANNVLLYGDAGTGKSTSIKAILNQYYSQGLRIIEVYKHQFKYLSKIISEIKNRNYRFIIYMDDLSFEEFETDYKYLKAIIEGGLEPRPENVLIYATSNRRHLIRETWSDRDGNGEDIHRNDTIQEKLSLSARFGVTIGYYKPNKKEYMQIVDELAKRYPEITLSQEEIEQKANVWMVRHGGASGRAAQQFIDYLAGHSDLESE